MPLPAKKTKNSTSNSANVKDTYADEIAVPCKGCEKMVSDKGLQCSFCDNWFCHPCTELTQAVLKSLDDTPDSLMWFCKVCTTALPGLKKLLVRVTTCESEQSNMKKRLNNLEEKGETLENKNVEIEKRLGALEKQENSKTVQDAEVNLTHVVDNVLSERADQEKRKFNLICSNLRESDKTSPSERRADDLELMQDLLLNKLEVDSSIEITELVRLGKRGNESNRPRPLRFRVQDLESKNILLRAGKYLRNSSDESVKDIYITPDLTKNQRDEAYKLRQEKKLREEKGEVNLRIVRGKIIKEQRRAKPVRPTSGKTLRYKWYEPPSSLMKGGNNDIRARHPSFDDDGDGIEGSSGWQVD
ncbi:MAG: hypothetical protein AB2693_35075 [Candidatus Thiodiazotropha sp.]